MTIWCNSCKCHVSAPCASHPAARDQRSSCCRRFRSTKGASKARRDHINNEIKNMQALLPISQEDRERLSYLHSMALICTYIRKSVLLQGLPAEEAPHCSVPSYEAFLQALHGFILVTTAQGRLVYVSENVAEYLGLSMVDVLQGDTLYDMVESSDIAVVQSNLDMQSNSSSERSFICCMQTSKAFKLQHGSSCSVLVRGSFQCFSPPALFPSSAYAASEPVFVALCTPTVDRLCTSHSLYCHSFSSVHSLDMTFTQLSDSVLYFLGYSAEEMTGRSWYSLVHPEDLSLCADSHRSLTQAVEGFQVEMVLRLQCKDLSWIWIYVQASKLAECQGISCTNFIISKTEARFLQQKIRSDAFRPSSLANSCNFTAQQGPQTQSSSSSSSSSKSFKRRRTSSSHSEEPPSTRARSESGQDVSYMTCSSSQGDSSPVFFTPPYSPASCSSPPQPEEFSHDLPMDMHGYTDQLLSSPEASPSYYSYPEAGLTCHHSPSDSLPSLEQAAFSTFDALSPLSASSSPGCDFPACSSDARLVPDCLSLSADMCQNPVDSALHLDNFSLPEQPQGGDLVQVQHVPHHVLPLHNQTNHYSEREQAEISILAQQISSLASSFALYHTVNSSSACDWNRHPAATSGLPPKHEQLLDDSVLDNILKGLDVVKSRLSDSDAAPCSYQQTSACSRTGSHQPELEPLAVSPHIPEEPFSIMEAFGLQLGRHDQTTGLYQLNYYVQSGLQRDGLVEENLY